MLEELSTTIIVNAAPLNLASFLIGLILGHRFNLWRDRRNELNEAKKPIRKWLVKQLEYIQHDLPLPDICDVDMLQQLLPWYIRKRFTMHWRVQREELKNGYTKEPTMGGMQFVNSPARIAALEKLLQITNHY